jgi:tetratricopeptide (TPR) repeat protein
MDRCALVHRCKRTGAFLLQPVDTSRGRGVSINLYREVPTDDADKSLGETVINLLALSGPTGAAFAEAKPSSGTSRDEETERINCEYGVGGLGPTSVYARWFLLATVKQRHARKAWTVHVHRYDSRRQAMSGEDQPSLRVRHSAGAAALGGALRAALDAVACSGLWGPGGSASHQLTLWGLELHEARRYAAALPYFERALRLSPNCPLAVYNRANTLYMLERDAEAEPLLRGLIAASEEELGQG